LLLVGKIPEAVSKVVSRTIYGVNRPEYTAVAAVGFILVNTVLNVVLVATFGIIGAAVATTIGFIVNVSINLAYLRRHIAIRVEWRHIGLMVGGSALMGIVLLGLQTVVPVETTVHLVVTVILGGLIYSGAILLSPRMRRDVKALVASIGT
jgi:O-antigen/teichoic acid export membrane protein